LIQKLIPKIGLGTYNLRGKKCSSSVLNALDIGYRFIDTAQAYFNEKDIGTALQQSSISRKDLIIASKVWISKLSPKRVKSSTLESLKKLKLDYLDIMYIHWPAGKYNPRKTIAAFQELLETEQIHAFAVSNFTPLLIDEIHKQYSIPIWGNQVEHHLFLHQNEMREYLTRKKMNMVAYSPLARGRVTKLPILQEMAKKYSKTPTQIALAWIIAHGVIPIPKSSSQEHLKQNYEARKICLSQDDIAQLDGIKKQKRLFSPPFLAPKW
jgi:2,5-diketo-D-gluconate reductase B